MDLAGFAPVIAGMAMSAPVSVPAALGGAAIKGGQKFLQKIGPAKIGALTGFAHGSGGAEPGERLSGGALNAVLGGGLGYGIGKSSSVARFLGS